MRRPVRSEPPPPPGPARREGRERRRAVERVLAREGLVRGPRPLAGSGDAGDQARRPWGLRLAAALAELGPVFTAFGRHLATRPDLLGSRDRRHLAEALPDAAPPLPAPAVAELFTAELGRPPEDLFARFEPEPLRSGLLEQVHRARLPGGGDALVRIVRPEVEVRLEEDLPLLAALAPVLAPVLPPALPLTEVLTAFREELAEAVDLAARGAGLEALAAPAPPAAGSGAARERDLPAVPPVHARLSSRRILTTGALETAPAGPAGASERAAYERARALHSAWLRLALDGRGVVVDGEAAWLPDGRPALLAPRLDARTAGPLRELVDYLRAVAAHDSARALERLGRDLEATARALPEAELAKRMRQAVPFGDSAVAGGDTVADHALLHWRLARECGYRPSPRLQAFYRGLLWAVSAAGWSGDGGRDPLRDALEDAAWQGGWDDLRALGDPERLWSTLEGHLGAFATLPATLERAVEALERMEGGRRPDDGAVQSAGSRGSGAVLAGLGLAMVAVAVLAGEAAAAGAAWAEPVGGVAFLTLGCLLFRFTGGSDRRIR